jgi:receptor protein-tyrosine kinase
MSAADDVLDRKSDQLIRALIEQCDLTAFDLQRIAEAVSAMHLSFVDAALHIGVVTAEDVDEALAAMHSGNSPGIIESLVRRQSVSRSLVIIPEVLGKASQHLAITHSPESPRAEAIRALRTELLLRNEPGLHANLLALMSPSAGEGRSQLTAELAIAFSQLGRRTLLVDADLRRPRQHQLFCADNAQGLTQALVDGADPQFIGIDGLPHLWLLRSGPTVPNPSELLAGRHTERVVSMWRRDFDFVLVDTPPVAEFSDGLIMAALIGRVLVVSRANVSTHQNMKEMLRRLVSTRSRILGSVLNRF